MILLDCVSATGLLFVCPLEQLKKSMLVKNVVRIGSLIKIAAYSCIGAIIRYYKIAK
jgi:hypothetical protein